MARSATIILALIALAVPVAFAQDLIPLDYHITTLRASDTWVSISGARSLEDQSGNPKFITAMPNENAVLSQGRPSSGDEKNELNILRQDLQAIETLPANKRSQIGGIYLLPERASCEAPLVGTNTAQFNVTANKDGVVRIDCIGSDALVLRGRNAKCISTYLPNVDKITVEDSGKQEIIFSPTSGNPLPNVVTFQPQRFSLPSDTSLVLEMPRFIGGTNYTMTVEGNLPWGNQGDARAVVVRGCNVQKTVVCNVKDALGAPACAFVEQCFDARSDAVAWLRMRRQMGECAV